METTIRIISINLPRLMYYTMTIILTTYQDLTPCVIK